MNYKTLKSKKFPKYVKYAFGLLLFVPAGIIIGIFPSFGSKSHGTDNKKGNDTRIMENIITTTTPVNVNLPEDFSSLTTISSGSGTDKISTSNLFHTSATPGQDEGMSTTTISSTRMSTSTMSTTMTMSMGNEEMSTSTTDSGSSTPTIPATTSTSSFKIDSSNSSMSMTSSTTTSTTEMETPSDPVSNEFILQYTFNRRLSRQNDVPDSIDINVSCSITESPSPCPPFMETYAKIEQRDAIAVAEKVPSLKSSFSKSIVRVHGPDSYVLFKSKSLYADLDMGGSERHAPDDLDIDMDIDHVKLVQVIFSTNDTTQNESPTLSQFQCYQRHHAPSELKCSQFQEILQTFVKFIVQRIRIVLGSLRLNLNATMGYSHPWILFHVGMEGSTGDEGALVRDYIETFNNIEMKMCECQNTAKEFEIEMNENKSNCYKILNVGENVRIAMDPPRCKSMM